MTAPTHPAPVRRSCSPGGLLTALALALLVFPPPDAAARTKDLQGIALVVGANRAGGTFLPLQDAEASAEALADTLHETTWFSPERTVHLTDPTVAQFRAALTRVEELRAAMDVPPSEMLFLFHFVGHGLESRLLLRDGAIEQSELTELIERLGLERNLLIFDACRVYGPTRAQKIGSAGFEPMLPSDDTAIINSTGPGLPSWEVEGQVVFTRALLGGMRAGVGRSGERISLWELWDYAATRTREVVKSAGEDISQSPVSTPDLGRTPAWGGLTMTFSDTETTMLEVDPAGARRVTLHYTGGESRDYEDFHPTQRLTLDVYAGSAWLEFEYADYERRRLPLRTRPGTVLRVSAPFADVPMAPDGAQSAVVAPNEMAGGLSVPATLVDVETDDARKVFGYIDGLSMRVGMAYEVNAVAAQADGRALRQPFQLGRALFLLDWTHLHLALSVAYGRDERVFGGEEAWDYQLDALEGRFDLGAAWNAGRVRLGFGAGLGIGGTWTRHAASVTALDDRQSSVYLNPSGWLSLLVPNDTLLAGTLRLSGGGVWADEIGYAGGKRFGGTFGLTVGLVFRLP